MESATIRPVRPLAGSSRILVVGALLVLAGAAWALTADRMHGMDGAPAADPGALGWFTLTWLVMMAAMMLPALAPTALVFARAGGRAVAGMLAGYMAAWSAAGMSVYVLLAGARSLHPAFLAWDRAGRFVAAGVLLVAAAYQLTPVKASCLDRCRRPLRLASRRPGTADGLLGGLRHGAACIGCCVWLMAALCALGEMSVTWMVVVAALIGAERLSPWRTAAVHGVAATLAVLALWMVLAPGHLPGLVLPGSMHGM
jgi:predicted metal-binding membrane protein